MTQPRILASLAARHGAYAVVGLELEWYLTDEDGIPAHNSQRGTYLKALAQACAHLPIHSMNEEDGHGQVEAALLHTRDIGALTRHESELRHIATQEAHRLGLRTDFRAKPFAQDYGNGLHIHIHLEDENGASLYYKRNGTMSDALLHSIGGLLKTMPTYLDIFTGTDANAHQRFTPHYHAPVNVSWGMNNRTTALRIPDGVGALHGDDIARAHPSTHRRIEHRVAHACAIASDVIEAIMLGIYHGLTHRCNPVAPVYGNASDKQYALAPLVVKNSCP